MCEVDSQVLTDTKKSLENITHYTVIQFILFPVKLNEEKYDDEAISELDVSRKVAAEKVNTLFW